MTQEILNLRAVTIEELYFNEPIKVIQQLPGIDENTPKITQAKPPDLFLGAAINEMPINVAKKQIYGPSIKTDVKLFLKNNKGKLLLGSGIILIGALLYISYRKEEERKNKNRLIKVQK